MAEENTRTEIADAEAADTFESISNLDEICDTTLIAVTFLLAAVATWTAFAYGRLEATPRLQLLFGVFVIASVGVLILSVNQLVRALSPRAFYGQKVGEAFGDGVLSMGSASGPSTDVSRFAAVSRHPTEDVPLDVAFDEWLEEYAPREIEDRTEFALARLFNYKHVARVKAKHTSRGLAWFRLSIILFVVIVVIGISGPVVTSL